jgi:hypothetical protein
MLPGIRCGVLMVMSPAAKVGVAMVDVRHKAQALPRVFMNLFVFMVKVPS